MKNILFKKIFVSANIYAEILKSDITLYLPKLCEIIRIS